MCGFCGTIHQHSIVSSKRDLRDFEVMGVWEDGQTLFVREVSVCDAECNPVPGTATFVPASEVELFETFYSRMH